MVRIVDSATATYLQARQGVIPRNFVWITAKNISTGLPEEIGFWDGIDTVDVTVVSGSTGLPVTRTYHAWGSLLKIDNIQRTPEIAVRNVKIGLSSISPEVRQAFRGYNTRLAPIEVHRGFLDLDRRQLIAPPIVRLVGWINKAPAKTPAVGSEGGIEATVVSHARLLTRTNPGKRSDETQKLRDGDRFRRYANVAADWEFWWGEKRGKISDSVATAPKEVFKGGA